MTLDESLGYLRKVGLFAELAEDDLRLVAARMQAREYRAGAVIVGQEDPGDSLFVVTRGRVKVALYGESGREIILSTFRPGELFGEMSLFDRQPRSASVIAMEPTEALVLQRQEFERHLRAHPDAALAVLAEMSRRLRQADRVIGNLALLDVYGRVARMLRDLADKEGRPTDEGVVIGERPTQAEIASMIGTSRETVSRALNDFVRRGLIVMTGKQVLLRRAFDQDDVGG